VLPLLRLRWVLLNNPSCLRVTMHRLHILVLHPPFGPWNAVESPAGMNREHLFVLWWDIFFLVTVKERKEVRGGGLLTDNEQEQKHTETAPDS